MIAGRLGLTRSGWWTALGGYHGHERSLDEFLSVMHRLQK
jgi:hypothetical protein